MPEEYIKKQDVISLMDKLSGGYSWIETSMEAALDEVNALECMKIVCCEDCEFGEKVNEAAGVRNLYYCHSCCVHRAGEFYCANGKERKIHDEKGWVE